jgi:hypothetical protein
MSKSVLIILLVFVSGRSFAQQDYFVQIQSDNNQPFFARIGERTTSSSTDGNLVLSQLKDSIYVFKIWFPRQGTIEQQFTFKPGNDDQQLRLRDLGEKGLALFNPKTQELRMADKIEESDTKIHPMGVKKDDAFSRLMAGVVGDTAVMYNTYTMEEAPKDSPVLVVNPVPAAAPESGSQAVSVPVPVSSSLTVDSVKPAGAENAGMNSGVVNGGGDSSKMILKDTAIMAASGNVDHPKGAALNPGGAILDPTGAAVAGAIGATVVTGAAGGTGADLSKTVPVADSGSLAGKGDSLGKGPGIGIKSASSGSFDSSAAVVNTPVHLTSTVRKLSERRTTRSVRMVYIDHIWGKRADTIIMVIPVDTGGIAHPASGQNVADQAVISPTTAGTAPSPVVSPGPLYRPRSDSSVRKTPGKPVLVNSDCRDFASDYDVDKLRVRMLDVEKDDDKILAAKKVFKVKCFTTRQIKALSEVFTTDAFKYKFFENAYPFVSDDHFRELAELLADPVYNAKFKVMTGPR